MRKPMDRDRLGVLHTYGTTRFAQNLAVTSIPTNQTMITLDWLRVNNTRCGNTREALIFPFRNTPTTEAFGTIINAVSGRLNFFSKSFGGGGTQSLGYFQPEIGDYLLATVIDRDNTRLEFWVNGVLCYSDALTTNPDLSANNRMFFWNYVATAVYADYTNWRSAVISLANGSTPTAAQWSEIFRAMLSPDAPLHPTLAAAIGSSYSDYKPGEGVYGSTTITDNGTNGDNLTWQGGTTVENVRTRIVAPTRKVTQDWYYIDNAYTAATSATNFGFVVQPVIMRAVCGERPEVPTANNYSSPGIISPASTNYVRVEHYGSVNRCTARANGTTRYAGHELYHNEPCDIWIVCSGTDWYIIRNGQIVNTPTALTDAIDLSGAGTAYIKQAAGDSSPCCRVAAWNPATVPPNLLDEIRQCVMNPELDPPSLTNKRVDFPLNATTLPLGTSTTVANQGLGGGTLTLSAQRSTSCKTMLRAKTSKA